MAFIKRLWKDRISEFPNRRTINDGNVTKQVTVGRDEGNITEEGDSFDASNMNDLEQRIEDAYGDVQGLVASEVAQQYDSSNVIFDAEPTEGHGTGYTVTSEGIKTAIDSGLVHTKTVSGSLVHITDGADNIPVKSLVSEIVAVETGNGQPKSPDNPYTISGFANGVITRCGKNIIDFASHINSTSSGLTISASSDGSINYNGTPSNSWAFLTSTFNYYLPSGTTITFSRQRTFVYRHYLQITFADNSSDTLIIENNATSVTKTFTKSIIKLQLVMSGLSTSATYNDNVKLILNIGTSALPYEPYTSNTYTFAFGQTVYGGHFDNKGNLVVTHKIVNLDSLTWTKNNTVSGKWRFKSSIVSDIKIPSSSSQVMNDNICSMYGNVSADATYSGTLGIAVNGDGALFICDLDAPDKTALETKLVGQKYVYELANPISLAITSQDIPTLLGENNIFSDCGDVEVTYYVDTEALYAIRDVIDEFAMQSDWNEADNTKADYIKNKPTIPANADFSLSGLSDTDISSASAGQVLVFDGDNWVNSDVEDNYLPNYWSLFADQNTSNTIKTLNVVSGRKISDFSVLFAVVIRESGERVSTIIPVGRFTNGIWVSLTEVDSINTQRWYEVKYVDDEHITVQCSTNATGSEVYIYGLGTAATYS